MPIAAGCIVEIVETYARLSVLPVGTVARVVSVHQPVDMRTNPPRRCLLRPLDDSYPLTYVDEDELEPVRNKKMRSKKCHRCPDRFVCYKN